MKVALVYDRVNKIGGAERVLLALHEIWPEAPLYTAVYDKKGAPWADVFNVRPSFLQNIPFAKNHHELFPWLTPIAFESFNFDEYDVIISITSAEAKGIITKPETLHICYCLTPTRYLWSDYYTYLKSIRLGILTPITKSFVSAISAKLRLWDRIAAERPDYYLSISQNVASRIKKYYRRDSVVIYPPVDTKKFNISTSLPKQNDTYFLIVSRLVPYKKIDIAIRAFNKLELPLKIIGSGVEEGYLRKIARKNIEFIEQRLTDEELIRYYRGCQALIFPGVEDFGLVPIEVQACGRPVIAYKEGGLTESVLQGITGEFFYPQTEDALVKVIKNFKVQKYTTEACQNQAKKFAKELFKKQIKERIMELYKSHIKNLSRAIYLELVYPGFIEGSKG